jgi:penicillin amidase
MLRRIGVLGWMLVWVLSGCSSSNEPASIKISINGADVSGGTVPANGPQTLTATVKGTTDVPSWSLTGQGTLSGKTGVAVIYRPPAVVTSSDTATVTASAGGASTTVKLTLAPGGVALSSSTIAGLTQTVTVLTDPQGIPHIQCAALNDCFAVQGWMHARDRLFQMDFLRHVARGTLAELVGPLGLSQDEQIHTLFTGRTGERIEVTLARGINATTRPKIEAYVAGVNAFLAAFRATDSLAMPGEYAQLPFPVAKADIPDWSVEDVMALSRLQQFQLSETIGQEEDYGKFYQVYGLGGLHPDMGKVNTWIRSAQPANARGFTLASTTTSKPLDLPRAPAKPAGKAGGAKVVPTPPLIAWRGSLDALAAKLAVIRHALKPLDGSFGSNNWVVDAAHSATGKAMVANDPHLSLQYPPNFYLNAMTSSNAADNLDVTGGSFPGIPGALVGRGKNVGWGVTVVGYDVTDIYIEKMGACPGGTPAGIPCPLVAGVARIPLIVPQSYKVRVGAGAPLALGDVPTDVIPTSKRPQAAVIVVPAHGPLVTAPDASGVAFSVRWTGHETWTQPLDAFLGLNTATSVAKAMEALDNYDTGAQNFVLADDGEGQTQSHIAFYPHALVPVRNFAQPPWMPLRGYDASAEWGTGNAADHCAGIDLAAFYASPNPFAPVITPVTPAAGCFIAKEALPQGIDPGKGFFVTANSDPLGKTGNASSPAVGPIGATWTDVLSQQPYLSFDWDDPTGVRATRIIDRLTALTASGGKVTLDDMQKLQGDHYSLVGKLFVDLLNAEPYNTIAGGTDASSQAFAAGRQILNAWAQSSASFDCPTGLTDIDPESAPDTDATVTTNSAGCYLFHAFLRTLLRNVFTDDLTVAGLGVSGGPAVRGMLYMMQPGTPAGDQSFCLNVDPKGQTINDGFNCPKQVVKAMATAFGVLSASLGATSNWRWGRVHTMQPKSLFALVTTGYEPGPFARPGGALTVDVGSPSLSSSSPTFEFTSSGNVRHISVMDAASPVVKMQLPGPEKDVPAGVVQGADLLGKWVRNQYFDYLTGSQIGAAAVATQQFKP